MSKRLQKEESATRYEWRLQGLSLLLYPPASCFSSRGLSHWSSSNVRSYTGGFSQRIFWKFPAEGFIPPSAFEAERHIETDWGKPFYSDSDLLLYRLLGSYLVILVFLENIWILIVIIKWQKGEFLVWDFWFILNQDFLVQTILCKANLALS